MDKHPETVTFYGLFQNYGKGWECHVVNQPWDKNPNWRRIVVPVPADLALEAVEATTDPA